MVVPPTVSCLETSKVMNRNAVLIVVFALTLIAPKFVVAQSEAKARQIAEATISRMGGMDAWNAKRYLVWKIFGEMHYWDKWGGDYRWEQDSLLVLMNVQSRQGRAWLRGAELKGASLKPVLDRAYSRWINNSYWLIMPYKLLDPGVMLSYVGTDTSMAGQISDVIQVMFDHVGLTPNNKYLVWVDRASEMVCQWAYYPDRGDPEPDFVRPWNEWHEISGVWMSTGRGTERHHVTNLALPDTIPSSVFTDPAPVTWRP